MDVASALESLRGAFKAWEWEARGDEIHGSLKPEGEGAEIRAHLAYHGAGIMAAWHATLLCGSASLGIHEGVACALRRAIWNGSNRCYWRIIKNL